jgi:hypothetical protein
LRPFCDHERGPHFPDNANCSGAGRSILQGLKAALMDRLLDTCIVGGGPAGIALLLAARRSGLLDDLLATKITIIERSASLGRGEIGDYQIRSDSLADSFLKSVEVHAEPDLSQLPNTASGKVIAKCRGHAVSLALVGDFLVEMTQALRAQLQKTQSNLFMENLEALRAVRQPDGLWATTCRQTDGSTIDFRSRAIVLATGAHQPLSRLYENTVAGAPLLPRFGHKTIQSAQFLKQAATQTWMPLLAGRPHPRVAIVGGSHSAIASAYVCLNDLAGITFGDQSITVLHRRKLRLTYASPADALQDKYDEFGPTDICPKTGRVFPLAGFRSDSRELVRGQWGLGGLEPDRRLRLFRFDESQFGQVNTILEEADLIISAMGYLPRALPLFNHNDEVLHLLSDHGAGPLVDKYCRVLDSTRTPIAGAFAMGLAAGYPLGGVHGEPSFNGEANGLALWQSDIGETLIHQLLGRL